MQDGYYLSTNILTDTATELSGCPSFKGSSASLWRKRESCLSLIRHWDLEKETEYFDLLSSTKIKEKKDLIELLLNDFRLSSKNITTIPSEEFLHSYSQRDPFLGFQGISQCQILSLLPLLLIQSGSFYQENMVILKLDKDQAFISASSNGNIQIQEFHSLPNLWDDLKTIYHMDVEALIDLSYFCTSKFPKEKLFPLCSLTSLEEITTYMQQLINTSGTSIDVSSSAYYEDSRFSYRQHNISMHMKVLIEAFIRFIEVLFDNRLSSLASRYSDYHLALQGNHPLIHILTNMLVKKYKFRSIIPSIGLFYTNHSINRDMFFFYKNIPSNELIFNNRPEIIEDVRSNSLNEIISPLYAPYIQSICPITKTSFAEDLIEGPIVYCDSSQNGINLGYTDSSILIDPSNEEHIKKANIILQREWWRKPIAVTMEDQVCDWYVDPLLVPGIRQNLTIEKSKLEKVSPLLTPNLTSNVEILSSELNPILYGYIKQFHAVSGLPLVGKVTLHSPNGRPVKGLKNLLDFSIRKGCKVIYINGKRIQLQNHNKYFGNTPLWV